MPRPYKIASLIIEFSVLFQEESAYGIYTCSMSISWELLLNLNESIFRTLGARGISINNEFVKNEILLRASRFIGTSVADSFTVNKRYRRLI